MSIASTFAFHFRAFTEYVRRVREQRREAIRSQRCIICGAPTRPGEEDCDDCHADGMAW